MHVNFWQQRWQENQIGFHVPHAHPLLVKLFPALQLKQPARIFLPLCGKTLDIAWLLSQGWQVAGAELSEIAVSALFSELALNPTITDDGRLKRYSAPNVDIWLGDYFALTAQQLGHIDAIYDRAALVALPEQMRSAYTAHLIHLSACARQLLISFDYEQSKLDGPPFSVPFKEINTHYALTHHIGLLSSEPLDGGLKGQVPALEKAWLLSTIKGS